VARRFGVSEADLRRALFEETGEACTRNSSTRSDLEVFLPPIGGQTAYIFGDPQLLPTRLSASPRACTTSANGSDVFARTYAPAGRT